MSGVVVAVGATCCGAPEFVRGRCGVVLASEKHLPALRAAIVPTGGAARCRRCVAASAGPTSRARRPTRHPWAELLRRVFGLEVLRCPSCSGRRRMVAAITQGAVIRAILESLGLPTAAPVVASARGPPELA